MGSALCGLCRDSQTSELTIRQLLYHLVFFASDAVLENAVSALFTKRAERASAYVSQQLS